MVVIIFFYDMCANMLSVLCLCVMRQSLGSAVEQSINMFSVDRD